MLSANTDHSNNEEVEGTGSPLLTMVTFIKSVNQSCIKPCLIVHLVAV